MSVSAIIVTRGDVELAPILASFPSDWEHVIWDNSRGVLVTQPDGSWKELLGTQGFDDLPPHFPDLSVYGRYASIQYASHDLIYVQDDDCIVSHPQRIANAWISNRNNNEYGVAPRQVEPEEFLVANMPQEFRPHYPDSCLVGFGACFHRDLPDKAFAPYVRALPSLMDVREFRDGSPDGSNTFRRTCDVVFTTLTPRVLVDVPVEVLPYAHDSNRMWKQPDHYGERTRVLEMARKVRDAASAV